MISAVRLAFFILQVGLSVAAVQARKSSETSQAQLLCSNKRVALTSLSQLEELQGSIEKQQCPENIRGPLGALIALIKNDSNKRLCSQEKADEILAFYRKLGHIHKDLKKVYLAYGLKVSSICRRSLLDELLSVVQSGEVLAQEDLIEMNKWTGDGSPFASLLSDPSDYEDLIIPKHMINLLKASDSAFHDKGANEGATKMTMFMQTSTNGIFASIKATCKRKFKPIYDQLITPLVTLSSVGFNYKGEKVDRDNQMNREVFKWYRTVFMCETLNNVEILEKPDETAKGKIRVFTIEEATGVFNGNAPEGPDNSGVVEFKRINPTDEHSSLGDLLLDLKDKHLIKAIKKHKEPSDRLSSRLNLKMAKFVLSSLKSKSFTFMGTLTSPLKGLKRRFMMMRKKKEGIKTMEEPMERDDDREDIEQLEDIDDEDEPIEGENDAEKGKAVGAAGTETNPRGGPIDNKEVIMFFEELKAQIEKKSLSKKKSDRMVWKPLRVIVNVVLISLFLLIVLSVVFSIMSFLSHAALPLAWLAHLPHTLAGVFTGSTHAAGAISGAAAHGAGAIAGAGAHGAGAIAGASANGAAAMAGAGAHAAGAIGGAGASAAGAIGGAAAHGTAAMAGGAAHAAGVIGGAGAHAAGAIAGASGHAIASGAGAAAAHAGGAISGAAGQAGGAIAGGAAHAGGAIAGAAGKVGGAISGIFGG